VSLRFNLEAERSYRHRRADRAAMELSGGGSIDPSAKPSRNDRSF
jgi:hypothetical protein